MTIFLPDYQAAPYEIYHPLLIKNKILDNKVKIRDDSTLDTHGGPTPLDSIHWLWVF